MDIAWKSKKTKHGNFKPQIVLDAIEKIRTVSTDGSSSFSGFEIDGHLPALQSMLAFPPAAEYIDKSPLVWKALSYVTGKLTPDEYLRAINAAFADQTATSLQQYQILTSISLTPAGLPITGKIFGASWRLMASDFPKKYAERRSSIAEANLPVDPTPNSYAKLIVSVEAKSSYEAMTKALRAIDIQRGVWCLLGNTRWELHGLEWMPINVVRLGGAHTVHLDNGKPAPSAVWFEPNCVIAPPFSPANLPNFRKETAYVLKQLFASPYKKRLCDALLRFVRALDERDHNHALVKLWGALEELACPDSANYEKLTQRCAFCFKDTHYHRQILEHLRECRNQSVHSASAGTSAKVNCFQLQQYFLGLFSFHLRNVNVFANLDEANQFLDLPVDKSALLQRKRMIEKALIFVS
jgi:hypothetical protein